MKKLVPFFIFLLTLVSCGTATHISYFDTKTNIVKKNFKKIFIAEIGSPDSRVFLDNLAENISTDLKKQNIDAAFKYCGRNKQEAELELKAALQQNFDAILVFNPTDTSYVDISFQQVDPLTRIPILPFDLLSKISVVKAYKRKIKYQQSFIVQLFETIPKKSSLWNATLDVVCDFTKADVYEQISAQILNSLTTNHLIQPVK